MRILLTNDDGISAPGIQALMEVLSEVGEVFVVAPDGNRSAVGHGITLQHPIMVREVKLQNTTGYAISGTPADCVKLAVQGTLIPSPDLVISGINQGQNLGTDVLYSGTVSAAIEGALQGFPAIAVSLDDFISNDFSYAASFTKNLSLYLKEMGLPRDTLLNVNIPAVPEDQIRGVKITKLCLMRYDNVFTDRISPKGTRYFWQAGEIVADQCQDPNTDLEAVRQKYVSVSPIHFDLTNYRIMEQIQNWKIPV